MVYDGVQDPVQFGERLQQQKDRELKQLAARKSCPFERWGRHRADQLVRDWMGKGAHVRDAIALGETSLDDYNDYLFLQSAIEEARPHIEEKQKSEAKAQQQHDDTRKASMKP